MRTFKFIDLFAGIGGFRCAMHALGGDCVFSSEWDKFALKTYRTWFEDDHVFTEDIRELDPDVIPNHDILCAGFPCQPFSLAGVAKKKSLGRSHGFDDEKQGNLFFSILDIIDSKRPPVVFLENVKNLLSHDKGNTFAVIKDSLEARGYDLHVAVIDARHWVPQHRERVFIVGFDRERFDGLDDVMFSFPTELDSGLKRPPVLRDILEQGPINPKYMLGDATWECLKRHADSHKRKGNGFGYGLFGPDDVARTLSARYHKDGSEILIAQPGWRNPRRLTPLECSQLMGFHDRYASMFGHDFGFPQVVSDTQAYRQFGNAVVPLVVEAIGRRIGRVLDAEAGSFIAGPHT